VFFFFILFIYLFMAMLALRCCTGFSRVVESWGLKDQRKERSQCIHYKNRFMEVLGLWKMTNM